MKPNIMVICGDLTPYGISQPKGLEQTQYYSIIVKFPGLFFLHHNNLVWKNRFFAG